MFVDAPAWCGAAQPPESKKLSIAECLATLAWAVAENSQDRAEVEPLGMQALQLAEEAYPVKQKIHSDLAQVHYQCGSALLAIGGQAEARDRFDEVQRLDPKGHWARKAELRDPAYSVNRCS